MSGRHTLLGLPHPRSAWPGELLHRATSGAAPIEFLVCLTANEVLAVLGSARQVSAVLLDGASSQVDRDLVASITAAGCTAIGIEAVASPTDWDGLGCAAVLPAAFSVQDLDKTIAHHCRALERPLPLRTDMFPAAAEGGQVVAVSGPGGTGASCVAMALAQGLAAGTTGRVALLDGARRSDLAMYHDTGDVLPGLPELVERVSGATVDPVELSELVFDSGRGYDLMLGMRRARDWTTLRHPSVQEALRVVALGWETVVVDHDADLDTPPGRSTDLHDRHAMSLALVDVADLWIVVCGAGLKGLHDAARCVDEAAEAGVDPGRIQIVCNRTGRSPTTRSTLTASVSRLTAARDGCAGPPSFVPESARLEGLHRDGAALPQQLVGPVTATTMRLLAETARAA